MVSLKMAISNFFKKKPVEKPSFSEVKQKLDAIGPGMCLAKWKQVTIHLTTGHTHSCHHPKTHVIPIAEIKRNPSALHNTEFKKSLRKEMMTGGRPAECQYCWNVEDKTNRDDVFSDRVYKSETDWSWPHFQEVVDAGWTEDIAPSYLEISFSYGCNFKCSYCSPEISSKWMEEIQQYGAYPTHLSYNHLKQFEHDNKLPIPERMDNPYVDAFWEWWPTIYKSLHTFRITGGEPLMTKHTFRVLDYIIENPNPKLELAINSNLCVPKKLLDEFIAKIQLIHKKKAVKSLYIFTSCEAQGAQAEYIRFGLDYNEWLANCDQVLGSSPETNLIVMSTYNAFSVHSYTGFLTDLLALKTKYVTKDRWVGIDIPYLRNPEWMTMGILTADFVPVAQSSLDFMKANPNYYTHYEITRMQRVCSLFESLVNTPMLELDLWRKDFVIFVNEHDRRRGTDFLATFPELKEFYDFCSQTYFN
jgi:organic radical activating enzyme